jgi:lipopolysaccharide transport system permease protein
VSLKRYWILVDQMARMSLKADASRYFLGYVWWLLEPLIFVGVFYLVFELLLGTPTDNFLIFLICGKFCFIWFSKSVTYASRSIISAQGLVGKLNLPKSLFPMALIHEGLYKQATMFLLLFSIVVIAGYEVTLQWLWLVPIILTNYLLIIACGFAAAFVVCLFYDFTMLIQLGMMLLLFVSGIFWDPRALGNDEVMQLVFTLNPLAFLVDAYRQILLFNQAPDISLLVSIGFFSLLGIFLMLGLMRRFSQFLALRALTL